MSSNSYKWSKKTILVAEDEKGLAKTHDLCGPVIDAYSSRFIYVYGTSGTSDDTEVNRREAYQDALDWRTWANGNSIINQYTRMKCSVNT